MDASPPNNSPPPLQRFLRRLAWHGATWLRSARRRPLAALAIVALAVFAVGQFVAWTVAAVRAERTQSVAFFADEPLDVEIAPRDATPAGPRWFASAPSLEPLSLPAGEYRLRTIGVGRLGGTRDVVVEDLGREFHLDSSDSRYPDSPVGEQLPGIVDLGVERALVQFGDDGIVLRSGTPGPGERGELVERWRLSLTNSRPQELGETGWEWRSWRTKIDDTPPTPHVVSQFLDLDGDGIGDVVCGARHRAWVVAASGATGKVLWFAQRGDPPPSDTPASLVPIGAVLDPLLPVGDVDGDGVSDLIASFVAREARPATNEPVDDDATPENPLAESARAAAYQRTLELLSGKTGRPIWEFAVPRAWFSSLLGMPDSVREAASQDFMERGPVTVGRCFPLQLVAWGTEVRVAVTSLAGAQLLDLKSGQEAEPFLPFPHTPMAPPDWGDVDGDGRADVAWVGESVSPQGIRMHGVQVHSLADRELHWRARAPEGEFGRPLIVDLDGDGRCEVVTTRAGNVLAGATPSEPNRMLSHRQIECHAGADGKSLWSLRAPAQNWLDLQLVVSGPDVDGDGWRELFVAWRTDHPVGWRIAALSGRDGRTIWAKSDALSFVPPAQFANVKLTSLRWWQAGLDGWPQLLVELSPEDAIWTRESYVVAVSAGTGRAAYQGRSIGQLDTADLDHDGLEELLTFQPDRHSRFGRIHVRSGTAEVWRRRDEVTGPLADLDGDQVRDVGEIVDGERMRVVSGWSGRTRFSLDRLLGATTSFGPDVFHIVTPETPNGPRRDRRGAALSSGRLATPFDADRDGVPDVLVADMLEDVDASGTATRRTMARAFAGSTGRSLWTRELPALIERVTTVDLNGDERPELLWEMRDDEEGNAELLVTGESGGAARWSLKTQGRPTDDSSPFDQLHSFGVGCVDCDGDGLPDVVATAHQDRLDVLKWEARRGRDGVLLWTYEQAVRLNDPGSMRWSRFGQFVEDRRELSGMRVVEFADAAGPTVLFWSRRVAFSENSTSRMPASVTWRFSAVDPRNGKVRWEWASPPAPVASEPPNAVEIDVHPWRRGGKIEHVVVARREGPTANWLLDSSGAAQPFDLPMRDDLARLEPEISTWTSDANGDGDDELVVFDGRDLAAYDQLPTARRRWQRSLRAQQLGRFIQPFEEPDAETPTWVVQVDGPPPRLVGIDGRDGRIHWSCPLPTSDTFVAGLLGVPAQGRSPLVLFHSHGLGSGVYQANLGAPAALLDADERAARRASETTRPTADPRTLDDRWLEWRLSSRPAGPLEKRDPSWARPLPWATTLFEYEGWGAWKSHHATRVTAWGTLWALGQRGVLAGGLIVLPGWCLLRIIRRRQFTLRQLFLLPAVVLLVLTLNKVPLQSLETTFWFDESLAVAGTLGMLVARFQENLLEITVNYPLVMALLYAPLVVCVGRWVSAFLTRRWRTFGIWCAAWLVSTALTAAAFIAYDVHEQPWLDQEYYSPIGWWLIFWNGLYVLSWLALLTAPWAWLVTVSTPPSEVAP